MTEGSADPSGDALNLLILGGTQFLGRYLVETALARRHRVTLFNRGRTRPELFPQIEKLRGDRDGDLNALNGRKWDAVIDTCGFVSANVRASVERLAESVAHYTFISAISIYRDFSRPGLDESAPLAILPSGVGENESDSGTYGPRKALCEQAAELGMPGRVLIARPGIIVGPLDRTPRFSYWVRRLAIGGDVLVPNQPNAPIQLIDVRDLSEWVVRSVEAGRVGAYNLVGPEHRLTFEQFIEACKVPGGNHARLSWVDEDFLLARGVRPFSDLPFWIPTKDKEWAGHFAIDCRRALQSGLVFRPLSETARDTLAWAAAQDFLGPRPGLSPERERELLREWSQR